MGSRLSRMVFLSRSLAFLRFWRLPTAPFEKRCCEANRNREVRSLIFSEDCEVNSDYTTGRTEQWRPGSAFSGSCVVYDSAGVEVGNAALSCERLNAFRLRKVCELGHRRAVPLLNPS